MSQNSSDDLSKWVTKSLEGKRSAMEKLLRAIQPDVYKLCLRFVMLPQDAEDATQDILLKVSVRLIQFKHDSNFKTWVFRIATNHLLDMKKGKAAHNLSFDEFGEDLNQGIEEGSKASAYDKALLSEVRIGCTLAMLQCLSSNLRVAYIVGEILEFGHLDASYILGLSPESFRKRLSRAKSLIVQFMQESCGLINTENNCRCHKRVDQAISLGRVNKSDLAFSEPIDEVKHFPEVLEHIRGLEVAQGVASLFRAHKIVLQSDEFGGWLESLLREYEAVK